MSSIWDDPEMKVNDEFVKFEQVGDTIEGVILSIRAHKFDNNKVAPQILLQLDDGEEKTVTAGQVRLKAALSEERPEAGDRIRITLTDLEPRSGGKELKHFDVIVERGSQATGTAATPAAAPAPQPVAAPAPDAQAVAAALAALSPEQKKALGLAS